MARVNIKKLVTYLRGKGIFLDAVDDYVCYSWDDTIDAADVRLIRANDEAILAYLKIELEQRLRALGEPCLARDADAEHIAFARYMIATGRLGDNIG